MSCFEILNECFDIIRNECPIFFKEEEISYPDRKDETIITIQPSSTPFIGDTDWEVIEEPSLKRD